jgi:hypothetical protein
LLVVRILKPTRFKITDTKMEFGILTFCCVLVIFTFLARSSTTRLAHEAERPDLFNVEHAYLMHFAPALETVDESKHTPN